MYRYMHVHIAYHMAHHSLTQYTQCRYAKYSILVCSWSLHYLNTNYRDSYHFAPHDTMTSFYASTTSPRIPCTIFRTSCSVALLTRMMQICTTACHVMCITTALHHWTGQLHHDMPQQPHRGVKGGIFCWPGIGADPVEDTVFIKVGIPPKGQRWLELFGQLDKVERGPLVVIPLLSNLQNSVNKRLKLHVTLYMHIQLH